EDGSDSTQEVGDTAMTSLTGSDDRGRRRRNRTALVVVAAVGGALLVGMPQAAYAAPVTATVDGIVYEADDADPGDGATITGYTGGATALTIPASVDIAGTSYDVTAIGIGAFANSDLTSVVIPDSVTTMGRDAF